MLNESAILRWTCTAVRASKREIEKVVTAWTWTDQRSGIFRLSCFLLHRQQRLIHCRGSKCRFGKFSLESRSFPIGVYRSVFQLFIANHLNIVMTIASSDINSYLSWAIVRCIGFRVLGDWQPGSSAHNDSRLEHSTQNVLPNYFDNHCTLCFATLKQYLSFPISNPRDTRQQQKNISC